MNSKHFSLVLAACVLLFVLQACDGQAPPEVDSEEEQFTPFPTEPLSEPATATAINEPLPTDSPLPT